MSCTQHVRLIRSSDNICKACVGKHNLSNILFLIFFFFLFPLEERALTKLWKCIFKACTYNNKDCSDVCTTTSNLDLKGHLDLKL